MVKSERRKQNDKSDFHTFQTHLIPTVQTHLILVLLTFIPQSFFILIFNGEQKILPKYITLSPHILSSTIFLANVLTNWNVNQMITNYHK